MNLPNDLSNVHINVDSETARAIADQYITYRYVENFTVAALLFTMFVILPIYFVGKAREAARESRERRKREMEEINARHSRP